MALRGSRGRVPTRDVDLKGLLLEVAEILDIENLTAYLFGSRKDRTGSVRSDIDILLVSERRLTQEQAEQIWRLEPYLDIFVARNGVARSLVNESELTAPNNSELVSVLGAAPLFVDGDWQTSADELSEQCLLAQRNPAASTAPLYELYDAVPAERADVLVVTALTEEYEAVLQELEYGNGPAPSVRATVKDQDGEEWLVRVVNMDEMGSVGSALKTRDAILRTKAFHVVLVGICAGVPGEVELQDVVIPKTVIYYESAKISSTGERRGDHSRECDPEIVRRAASHAVELSDAGITLKADNRVMACGEKVVANEDFRMGLQERHRKLAAIDMESYGVVRAAESAGRHATVIKAVCDMADEEKGDKHHQEAAVAAARVFAHLLRSGVFKDTRP
ncbi:5'-methylthioadenosine/S-adenosylhomocysteine nucleosidase [Nocardioides ochotonae]|uniref:5'-methylthioadenosine/S-adenosylhomocysteine nucleosidase n=1 Tax=Nocardioides ochotonae TaxID=2685869 RepID=UPI001408018D|nr:5'-methylthioadenosine/S-adenosylhomocysteine nucleosidase [Nocardioides ochotonae]